MTVPMSDLENACCDLLEVMSSRIECEFESWKELHWAPSLQRDEDYGVGASPQLLEGSWGQFRCCWG